MGFRKTQIFREGGWKSAEFEDIKAGDHFRLYEPDGSPVKDDRGHTRFLAQSDAVEFGNGNARCEALGVASSPETRAKKTQSASD